jgi:hypothetical protein
MSFRFEHQLECGLEFEALAAERLVRDQVVGLALSNPTRT